MHENRKFLKSTRTGERKSINVFAKSTVMHISNDCFGLQKNHSARMKRPKGVSLDCLLLTFEDQLSITAETFSPFNMFDTWNSVKVG